MSFTESTLVTIHTHSTTNGASSTVVYNASNPPAYDNISTLGSDQFGDVVLGTAVLSGGNQVVISASIANNVNYNGFATYPGFPTVSETIIDHGVATTQTLTLTSGSDFLNAPDGEDLLKVVPLTGGNFVVVEEARTSANPNLYFELFNSSGTFLSGGQVNPSGNASELNDSFNVTPTSTNGFVVEWNEGNNQTGHFETFNVSGSTATGAGDKLFNDGTNNGTDGYIGNVAVATNGNVIVASNPVGAGIFMSSNFAIYTASGGTVVGPESFATAEGSLLPNETSSVPGDSGNPLENAEAVPQFVALPSGGFVAVIANPVAPYSSANTVSGFNMYLQTISASGVFGTPELVETTTNGIPDNTLNPVVLSNGDVVIDIGGHFGTDNIFVPGTFEVIDLTKTPANISTLVAMTPLFPSAVAPTEETVSPTGATSPLKVVIPNNADVSGGVTNTLFSANNTGGVFAALQSGIYTGFFGYGTLDSSLYAADFDPSPPTVIAGSTATFTGGGSAVVLDAGLTVSDATSSTLVSATVTIGGFITGDTLAVGSPGGLSTSFSAGVLTLTGTASLATYQTALDSVRYSFTAGGDPTGGGSDANRTIDWVVNDGATSNTAATSTLDVVHEAAAVTAGATATYAVGHAAVVLDSALTVTDADSGGNLTGATVTIVSPAAGDSLVFTNQNGITGVFSSGALMLSGTASLAHYQTALESIAFSTSVSSNGTRTIDWVANDGVASSTLATSTVDVVTGTISSSAYNASTGKLTVTGTNFTTSAANYSATALTLTGEGGTTYTLTGGSIEANPTSTTFVVDLSTADQLAVDGLLNKNGTSSVGTTTYNLAATSSFDTGGTADATSAVTVSSALAPTISSVSFNIATGVLTLGGTGFENEGGIGGLRLGDITLKGQNGSTYTLAAANAAVSSQTAASVTLTGADLTNVKALFNNNGTSSLGGTTYNLAATAGWDSDAGAAIATKGVTVSGYATFDVHVYYDANDNSTQDGGEFNAAGVTIHLLDGSANLIATTTTDASGNASFVDLTPSTYEVSVTVLAGGVATQTTNISTPTVLSAGGTTNAVEGVFAPPTAMAESMSLVAGATATGTPGTGGSGALDGDSDPLGLPLSVSAVAGGTVGPSVAGTYGHLTLNADGSYSYVADIAAAISSAATGSPPVDTFNYTVSDTSGASKATTLAFSVDRPPQIYNPDNVVAAAGAGAIALDIAAPTDVDDANTPTVTLNDIPTYGTVQYFNGSTVVTATSGTILTPTELASLQYIPPASGEFGGQTISYTAADGGVSVQGTIAITVVAEDTGPASLYFSAYGKPGNGGNPDLYTLNASGDPVAMPLNIANGSSAGEDGGFFQFAGNFYFNANGTATGGTEALYKLDPSGTVTAVSAGPNSSDGFFDAISQESADFTTFDGSLYFGALVNTGGQLVKLNADGSSQIITLDSGFESFPGQNGGFVEFDGNLYFSAITTATNGFSPDLIQLDPNGNVTEISTRSQANAAFGSNAGEDGGFYVFDKALYFNSTSDTSLGDTLFELTAGSTTPVAVDPTGAVLSHTDGDASGFHEFDGSLYFNEQSNTLFDDTLFKLDASGVLTALTYFNGTTNETLENAGAFGGFVDFAGSTYFVANTGAEGTQLFQLDGSGNITRITDTSGGAFDDNLPGNFVVFAGNLYFDAYDGSGGDNLYKLAPGATTPTVAFGNGPGFVTDAGVDGGFQTVNGSLYFSAFTADGYQLVQLNADGTTKVIDIAPPVNNSFDTAGNINALGVFPSNVISGPAGNDILVGSTPDETIIGGPDNNIIEGRGGNDILIGGGGSNDFVFSATGPANLDTVANYSLAHGDTLDVSALVDANFTNGSLATDFVRLIASGNNNLLLQVDPNGGVGGHVWEDVAILEDANVLAGNNQVTAFLNGTDYTITQSDIPPTVTTSGGTTTEVDQIAAIVDPGVTVADPDNATLASATVSITGGLQPGQDVLAFTHNGSTMGNISGSYVSGTGVLTLTSSGATATLAQWQAALRAVTYTDTSSTPNLANRTISFVANDGSAAGAAATKTVSLSLPASTAVTGTVQSATGLDLRWATLYDELANSPILARGTTTSYTATDTGAFNSHNAAIKFVVTGTGLTYSGSFPNIQLTGGTITGLEELDTSGNVLATFAGFSISAAAFSSAINTYMAGGATPDPSGLNALFLANQYTTTGGAGADHLQGGNVNDTFIASTGNDTLDGGAGTNTADYSGLATSGLVVNFHSVNKGGANGTDTLTNIQSLVGSTASDIFYVDGNETVNGGGGFDYLIELTTSINQAYGTNFTNITEFVSNTGVNTVSFAGDGNIAYLYGSDGNDTLTLGSGGGDLFGEGGTNILNGGANATNLFIGGGGGHDTMNGGSGTATNFYFVDGNDQVNGGGAFNTMIELVSGVTVQLDSAQYQDVQEFVADSGANFVTVANTDADLTYLYGGAGNDTLTNGSGGGYLIGEGGTNVLNGGSGSNVFVADGGSGTDTMNGGSGSNVYYIDGNSTVHGAGTFNTAIELQQNATLTLGSVQLGTDVQEVVLNGGTNTVDFHTATSSVYLYGGSGNDTLFGGTGNDFLYGGLGTNTFKFAAGWGQDTIMDWTAGSANQIDLTALSGSGVHAITDLTQTITNGNDVITSSHTGANSITLEGFNSTLTATSFKFA